MRIIQISDLHFGMHNADIIQPFLIDLQQLKPELIIISGDLTQRGKSEQYLLLQQFLQQLPVPYLAVPGNHDIPLYNLVARATSPFKHYKKYVSPQLGSSFINSEVNILGVNSVDPYKVKDGTLTEKTIAQIKNHFAPDTGLLNILFFHHNLHYFSGMHHPLNNAEEFISYLKDSSIDIVCTGHLHYSTLKLIRKNNKGQCAILHAGSLLCERSKDKMHGFYVIDTNKHNCTVDWRIFAEDRFISHKVHQFNLSE